jgi:hypothetical protein
MTKKAKVHRLSAALAAVVAVYGASPGLAESHPTLSFAGGPGILDMPSGESMPDATLSVTSAHFGPISRNTLSFQISRRLSGSFRYTGIRNWDDVLPSPLATNFDRSFDLRYQLAFEGKYLPAISIGLVDFIGTGLSSGEYIAATKTFSDGRLKLTAGLGWGKLGSYGAIGAPFGPRPPLDVGVGGTPSVGQWFKGDMAPFAGIEWQVNDRLGIKAEYSSNSYPLEAASRQTFDHKSPFNFGVEYQVSKAFRLGASYMYGSEFGLTAQFVLNPKESPTGGQVGNAPPPVAERRGGGAWASQWVTEQGQVSTVRTNLAASLEPQGITLERAALTATRAEVRIRVPAGENSAQMIGRAARVMSAALPASVEQFEIVPVANGLPLAKIILRRSDLEQLDNAAGQDALIRERAQIVGVSGTPADLVLSPGLYPKFDWTFGPYFRSSFFDPSAPVRLNLGVRLSATYDIAPGLRLSGSITKKLAGNLGGSGGVSSSVLPHVRSDAKLYDQAGDPSLEHLTLAWYAKPAPNLYSRVTVGYLERMFGGISGEVLWKPVNSRLALGAELNYVRQRDFDQLFGFQDYEVMTGHVSGYYAFDNGFVAQLDVGRYLAGDVGATLSLDRTFANGWKVGAFATLTDVSFEDFGEGSFDKGIRVSIPFAWMTGRKADKAFGTTIRPILRDGGARLDVDGRLYDTVRSYDTQNLNAQWGGFWR